MVCFKKPLQVIIVIHPFFIHSSVCMWWVSVLYLYPCWTWLHMPSELCRQFSWPATVFWLSHVVLCSSTMPSGRSFIAFPISRHIQYTEWFSWKQPPCILRGPLVYHKRALNYRKTEQEHEIKKLAKTTACNFKNTLINNVLSEHFSGTSLSSKMWVRIFSDLS
jgi:hypothetical protein